jgi:hypothetical protein
LAADGGERVPEIGEGVNDLAGGQRYTPEWLRDVHQHVVELVSLGKGKEEVLAE